VDSAVWALEEEVEDKGGEEEEFAKGCRLKE
jgi:hypothetical protein